MPDIVINFPEVDIDAPFLTTMASQMTQNDPGLVLFKKAWQESILIAANAVLVPFIKDSVGVPSPPVSDPGEEPHRQSDDVHDAQCPDYPHLQDAIAAWLEPDGSLAVGVLNHPYAIYLEIGTSKMAARPFLIPAMQNSSVINDFCEVIVEEFEKAMNNVVEAPMEDS